MSVLAAILVLSAAAAAGAVERGANTLPLAKGWTLQSSAQVKDPGEVVATPAFKAEGWYPITVPSTVVAGLVANKVYPDPYFGMNIRNYPGMSYPITKNFSKYPMDPKSPFAVPWWFRTSFKVPAGWKGRSVWLHFQGINYRANIWLNGQPIGKPGGHRRGAAHV